jgi:hypothetical protein
MGVATLDVDAAVSKVKKDKKTPKKAAKPKHATKPIKRATVSTFIRSVAGQGSAASATANAAGTSATKPRERVMPLQQRLKHVFDYVKEQRAAITFAAITASVSVPITSGLLPLLQQHPQLTVDTTSQTVKYKPKLSLASRDEVLALLRQKPFGVLSIDIIDAYAEGRSDIDALVATGAAFEVDSAEKHSSIVYPNTTPLPGGLPDEESRDMVFNVELPESERDIDVALAAAGIKKAKRTTARLKMAVIQHNTKAGKSRKARKLRNVTNAHMEHLFEDGNGQAQ